MDVHDNLAKQLRNARLRRGLSQQELAGKLNISRQMISRYESGKDRPWYKVLAVAAEVLDTQFEVDGFLITFQKSTDKPRPVPQQLRFDFGKERVFEGATVHITPKNGFLIIEAVVPA